MKHVAVMEAQRAQITLPSPSCVSERGKNKEVPDSGYDRKRATVEAFDERKRDPSERIVT